MGDKTKMGPGSEPGRDGNKSGTVRSAAVGPRGTDGGVREIRHQARTTFVGTVHYARDGAHDPRSYEIKFYAFHSRAVSPYELDFEAGPEWERLDTGGLTSCGLLLLSNLEGYGLGRIPSEEERVALNKLVVELGVLDPTPTVQQAKKDPDRTQFSPPASGFVEVRPNVPVPCGLVRPGRSLPIEPPSLAALWVRCKAGRARCRVVALPD